MTWELALAFGSVIVASLSVFFAWKAVREAAEQNTLSYKAIQAQTMMMIIDHAREIRFSQGMDVIRSLKYKDYKTYKKKEAKEIQQQVRLVVDFFNDLMHLIEQGYIEREHIVLAYKVSIKDCAEHLLPWWVDGFREENGNSWYYISFKKICEDI